MIQWLRTLTSLPEDLSSIPNTHMTAHNRLFQFQGIHCPLRTHVVDRQHPYRYNKIIIIIVIVTI